VSASYQQSPNNAAAAAVSALVDMAAHGGDVTTGAVDAVTRSYQTPATPETAIWRLDAATRAWPQLTATQQQTVIRDACAQKTQSPAFAAYLMAIMAQMPDAGLGVCSASPAPS